MTRTTQPNRIRGDDYAPARAFLASPLAALRPDFAGRALARIQALLVHRVEADQRPGADRARALLAGIAQRAGEADALIGELRRLLAGPGS